MKKLFKIGLSLLILGFFISVYFYLVWSNTLYNCPNNGCGEIFLPTGYYVGIAIAMIGVGIMGYDVISAYLTNRNSQNLSS